MEVEPHPYSYCCAEQAVEQVDFDPVEVEADLGLELVRPDRRCSWQLPSAVAAGAYILLVG